MKLSKVVADPVVLVHVWSLFLSVFAEAAFRGIGGEKEWDMALHL